ncbi:MAG: hypothetical protein WCH21_12130, partial [Bacteroidota bacterium]
YTPSQNEMGSSNALDLAKNELIKSQSQPEQAPVAAQNNTSILPFIKQQIETMYKPTEKPSVGIESAFNGVSGKKDLLGNISDILGGIVKAAGTSGGQSIIGALASGGNPYIQRAFADTSDRLRGEENAKLATWGTNEETRKNRLNDLTKEYAKEQADQNKYTAQLNQTAFDKDQERKRLAEQSANTLKSNEDLKREQIAMQKENAQLHNDTIKEISRMNAAAKTAEEKQRLKEKIAEKQTGFNKIGSLVDNLNDNITSGTDGKGGTIINPITSHIPGLRSDSQAAFQTDRNILVDTITKELVGRSSNQSIQLMKESVPSQSDTVEQRVIKLNRLKNMIKTQKDAIAASYGVHENNTEPTQPTESSPPTKNEGKHLTFNPRTGKSE